MDHNRIETVVSLDGQEDQDSGDEHRQQPGELNLSVQQQSDDKDNMRR